MVNEKSTFKVLISCMNQSDFSIAESSRLFGVPVFIVNQCETTKPELIKSDREAWSMLNTPARGLSVSRNFAINGAAADICLLSDDDEVFSPDLEKTVLGAYKSLPDADVIIFKTENQKNRLGEKQERLKRLDCLKVASWQISFKTAAIKNKIFFDEKMGAGTGNGAGEENKFLLDCYDAGLKIYYVPITVASVSQQKSTWFNGHDGKFFFDRGKATRRMLGLFVAFFYAIYYLIFKYPEYKDEISLFSAAKNLFCGLNAKSIDEPYNCDNKKRAANEKNVAEFFAASGDISGSLSGAASGDTFGGGAISRTQALSATIYTVALIAIIVAALSKTVFDFYGKIALFLNFAFLVVGLFLGDGLTKKFIAFISLSTAYFCVSALISRGGAGSVATFAISLAMPAAYTSIVFSKKQKQLLSGVCVAGLSVLCVYSAFYSKNLGTWSLTHVNTNTFGWFAMFLFMVFCVLNDFKGEGAKKNAIAAALFAVAVLTMIFLRSRGTLVALVTFAILANLPAKIYREKGLFAIAIAFMLIVAAFPFFYLHLYVNGCSFTFMGKPLFTGREELWLNMLRQFKQNPLTLIVGLGSNNTLGADYQNVHNGVFAAVVCFGLIGFVIYYGYILFKILILSDYAYNTTVKKSLIMFLCAVLLLGFTENSSFWAVSYPFAYFGLNMASSEKNLIEKNNKALLLVQKNR